MCCIRERSIGEPLREVGPITPSNNPANGLSLYFL